jgi:SNF2 family DNA or RNA helicase
MQLIKIADRWIAQGSYEEREIPKAARFLWDRDAKCWYTQDIELAAALAPYASEAVRAELAGRYISKANTLAASFAASSSFEVPVPVGLSLLPYQRAGVEFCSKRRNVLLCDEMGLGKTIEAIGIINADVSLESVLIIAPASLKLNWQRELRKWLTRELSIGIASGSNVPNTDIVIINYDIMTRNRAKLDKRAWDLLVCDEAHALKNEKAQRTKAVLGSKKTAKRPADPGIVARRKLMMTGTPILNRPNELWTLLQAVDRDGLGKDFWAFHKRYCNAAKGEYGWDFSGASNLEELQRRLRETGVMLRRLKADVLTELPAKRRQMIALDAAGSAVIVQRELAEFELVRKRAGLDEARARLEAAKEFRDTNRAEYEAAAAQLRSAQGVILSEMSRVRHATAVAKIPFVIEHLADALESEGKVICFAHHHDVIDALAEAFGDVAVAFTGDHSAKAKDAAVERFQTDPSCKLFLGSVTAASLGITLTASSHVVFAELDWRPAIVTQAEDRAHRIGQRDSVLVQHLVFDGSLDATMVQKIIEKQAIIDAALDVGLERPSMPAAAVAPPAQTEGERADPLMTGEQIAAVQAALRVLAALDPDRARESNDVGFNAYDGSFGHKLAALPTLTQNQAMAARRMLRKYKRQLGQHVIERMGN